MEKLSLNVYVSDSELPKDGMYCFNGDAADMGTILDSYNWFFMINPFGISKTIDVVNSIINSMDRSPRNIHLIYAEPMGHELLIKTGRFELEAKYDVGFYESTYWTYVYTGK